MGIGGRIVVRQGNNPQQFPWIAGRNTIRMENALPVVWGWLHALFRKKSGQDLLITV